VLLVLILFPRGLAGLCYDGRDWGLERLVRRRRATPPGVTGPVEGALVP
jgi:hypothetical protein